MSSISQRAQTSMGNKELTQDHPVPSKLCMLAQSLCQSHVGKFGLRIIFWFLSS